MQVFKYSMDGSSKWVGFPLQVGIPPVAIGVHTGIMVGAGGYAFGNINN